MNKKLLIVLIVFIIGFNPLVKSDEGMWLPMLIDRLNYVDMKKMGLNLTAEEIYSVNNSSLKDAIVSFGIFIFSSLFLTSFAENAGGVSASR